MINNVPVIAGSNRDEVKLWLGTAEYLADLEFSPAGTILGIPKVKLKMRMLLRHSIITEAMLED